jgi:hypothetical protein
MEKWEYAEITWSDGGRHGPSGTLHLDTSLYLGGGQSDDSVEGTLVRVLNEAGGDGWEAVGFSESNEGSDTYVRVLLKRRADD